MGITRRQAIASTVGALGVWSIGDPAVLRSVTGEPVAPKSDPLRITYQEWLGLYGDPVIVQDLSLIYPTREREPEMGRVVREPVRGVFLLEVPGVDLLELRDRDVIETRKWIARRTDSPTRVHPWYFGEGVVIDHHRMIATRFCRCTSPEELL